MPKLTFDARKDYEFAISFFERNFGDGQETDHNEQVAEPEKQTNEIEEGDEGAKPDGSLVGEDDNLMENNKGSV